jgi:hypothetical protein
VKAGFVEEDVKFLIVFFEDFAEGVGGVEGDAWPYVGMLRKRWAGERVRDVERHGCWSTSCAFLAFRHEHVTL